MPFDEGPSAHSQGQSAGGFCGKFPAVDARPDVLNDHAPSVAEHLATLADGTRTVMFPQRGAPTVEPHRMTRYRVALAAVAALIVAAVLVTVVRMPPPPATASTTGGEVLPASQRVLGTRFHRHRRVAQQPAADARRPQGQGGAHRLLDLLVRQLRAHDPAPARCSTTTTRTTASSSSACTLPSSTSRWCRPMSPQRSQRLGVDLAGRRRQRDGHLECVSEPVLAGGVPARSAGSRGLHELRRR